MCARVCVCVGGCVCGWLQSVYEGVCARARACVSKHMCLIECICACAHTYVLQ